MPCVLAADAMPESKVSLESLLHFVSAETPWMSWLLPVKVFDRCMRTVSKMSKCIQMIQMCEGFGPISAEIAASNAVTTTYMKWHETKIKWVCHSISNYMLHSLYDAYVRIMKSMLHCHKVSTTVWPRRTAHLRSRRISEWCGQGWSPST